MTIDLDNQESQLSLSCPGCGYDVTGMIENDPCPECGRAVVYEEARFCQSVKKSLVGMLLGVFSFLLCFGVYSAFIGVCCAVAALIVCESAKRDVAKNKAHPRSAANIMSGQILGCLGLVMNTIVILYMVLFWLNGPLITV